MRSIIFGITGQDGFYLNQICKDHGIEVHGVSRTDKRYVLGDVADREFVFDLIRKLQPDFVFHLAANSTTRHDALFENHSSISTGTINVLEACLRFSPQARIFLAGSALQFRNEGSPIAGIEPFEARDPYSAERIYTAYSARYFRTLGLKIYIGYFFHHDSSLRSEKHMSMRIARAAHRIGQGSTERLAIGNIEVVKEFNYAGDLMNAVWLYVNQDRKFETVIGSGAGYPLKVWAKACFDIANRNWWEHIETDSSFKPDFHSLVSDPSFLFSLGWRPTVSIGELARKMMTLEL
jgi:GDPmannose 4,6-dehydratase